MFTVYDVNDVASMEVTYPEKSPDNTPDIIGIVKITHKSNGLVTYIYEDDELYELHMRNAMSLKSQMVDSWAKHDAEVKAKKDAADKAANALDNNTSTPLA